jgi:adenosine deaminase
MYKTGNLEPILKEKLYDRYDLEKGIDYCKWLIESRYKKEPFYKFNLKDFIIWANKKLKSPTRT